MNASARLADPARIELLAGRSWSVFELPQVPADLKFVGVIVVQELEAFFNGLLNLRSILIEAIDTLKSRRFIPVDGPRSSGVDAMISTLRGK